jgi:FAD binding domain
VLEWLDAQVLDRGIEIQHATSLDRLVFEEGAVVGAEFTTPGGTIAVRARHGVMVAGGGPSAALATGQALPGDDAQLRLCLVGQTASRFGRVELLTSAPFSKSVPSDCRSVTRRLRGNMHETHSQLQTWRCGKVNGYPSLGQ